MRTQWASNGDPYVESANIVVTLLSQVKCTKFCLCGGFIFDS